MSASHHIVLFHHFRRLLEAAHGEGVDIAPLKGADLVTRFCDGSENRGFMADVDFLVRPAHLDALTRLLVKQGFTRRDYGNVSHEQGFEKRFDPGGRVLLEAHLHLFEPRRHPRIDTGGIWRRATPGAFDGAPCFRLAPEDVFCHVALHSALHGFDTLTRDLNDLSRVARATTAADVKQRAEQWGIRRIAWLMLTLLEEHLPDFADEDVCAALRPPAVVRATLPRLARSTGITSHRARMALLLPLIFDTPRAAAVWLAGHPAFRR
jgi:hypothetical protein